ncbi:hypothetical protein EUTSA_v100244351mg, partial [Eutrema salsugineum]
MEELERDKKMIGDQQ